MMPPTIKLPPKFDIKSLTQTTSELAAKQTEQIKIILHGPPDHGKSCLAASLSKHSPDKGLPESLTYYSDVKYIAFETGVAPALSNVNISVDIIDMVDLSAQNHTWPDLKNVMHEFIQFHLANTNENLIVVIDSLTMMASLILKHHEEHPKITQSGKEDKFAKWQALGAELANFYRYIYSQPCAAVLICHRAVEEPDSTLPDAEKKQRLIEAMSVPGSGSSGISIPGNVGKSVFRYGAPFIFALNEKRESGRSYRELTTWNEPGPNSGNGAEAKNKLRNVIPAKIRDPNLRVMLEDARKKLAGNGEPTK